VTPFERVIDLERIDSLSFESTYLIDEGNGFALFGGQVAAQGLHAAGLTVADDRQPHSLHCYFLRRGDSTKPVVFGVDVDRDGRGFSARRVTARQDGKVILSMSVSFHVGATGPESQHHDFPDTTPIEESRPSRMRLGSVVEVRTPQQALADATWPSRLWMRMRSPLPEDALVRACALTFLSDYASGVLSSPDGTLRAGPSLDHALWLHHLTGSSDWMLIDTFPQAAMQGRATYGGTIHGTDGVLRASFVQEVLYIPS
jgi:acyl-CoA thioesterase-2